MVLNRMFLCSFGLKGNKLSSKMDQINEQHNYTNQKVHSFDQVKTMVVNVGSEKCGNNYNSSPKISHLQNSLLMSIVLAPEKDVSCVEGKSDTSKVHIYLEKSSKLFLCSVKSLYNRVHHCQKQRLILKSNISGIDSCIGSNRYLNFSLEM